MQRGFDRKEIWRLAAAAGLTLCLTTVLAGPAAAASTQAGSGQSESASTQSDFVQPESTSPQSESTPTQSDFVPSQSSEQKGKNGASSKPGKTSSSEQAAISDSLREAEREKKELEQELLEAEGIIADLKQSKGNVEYKVAELNKQLVSISARITELEGELTAKNEDIVAAQQELAAAQQRKKKQYADMKVRIQYMYENSNKSYFETLISAQNITDLLNMVEYIREIESYDRQKLTEYEDTVTEITGKEQQLAADYRDLEQMKASVEENRAAVAAMMAQKEHELVDLKEDIAKAQTEADYFAAEIQAQEEMIAEIKRIEAEKAAAAEAARTYGGGAFVWPCPSSQRVTSDYGPREAPMSGASSNHKGIDIGAAAGADIVAAAEGTVKAAAYSSTAGNYVMIDHGSGIYTVYMHASQITVSVGTEVVAGQVIAKVGSTGVSTGNHLHFGVSVGGEYVSPWEYL